MIPPRQNSSRYLRISLRLILLLCFAGFQIASAITEQVHVHGESHADCCAICHASHASFVQPAGTFQLEAPVAVEWQTVLEQGSRTPDRQSTLDLSRAPPR
jgi:hypothetical protein